jgi:hypothetical protein
MKCQRCWSDQEPVYRVYPDALNIKVCATCAKEALGLGIAVEVLAGGKRKGNVEQLSLDSGSSVRTFDLLPVERPFAS